MDYPGEFIETGHPDDASVDAIRDALRSHGYAVEKTGAYGEQLAAFVRQFQTQHGDLSGRPLQVDGKVGPNTWGALFGSSLGVGIGTRALSIAEGEVGTMEVPPGSNRGPKVEAYLASVGVPPGNPWCMAFVHWCFEKAAAPGPCPIPRSGSVIEVLDRVRKQTPNKFIAKNKVASGLAAVQPGFVFFYDHGHGLGHTGFVKSQLGGGLVTIEGNTNTGASREGVGVFQLTRRSITDAELVGFADFS